MPTYVYECPDCGNQVEEIRPIAERDAPLRHLCEHLNFQAAREEGVRPARMRRIITPVHGRVDKPADGSTPKHHGGPDQFTADALGVTKKQLQTEPALSGLSEKGAIIK